MCILGTIFAAERLNQANDLPSFLEAGLNQGNINQVRKKGMGGNKHVPTWDEYADCAGGPAQEEVLQFQLLCFSEDSEAWQRASDTTIEGRRVPPYSTSSVSELPRLLKSILLEAIWGISHDGVNAVWLPVIKPSKAITMDKLIQIRLNAIMQTLRAHSVVPSQIVHKAKDKQVAERTTKPTPNQLNHERNLSAIPECSTTTDEHTPALRGRRPVIIFGVPPSFFERCGAHAVTFVKQACCSAQAEQAKG